MSLNNSQIQHIIILRGLGYRQQEVADKIKCSRKTVQNYLHQFKNESKENGVDETFWHYFNLSGLGKIVFSKISKRK